MRLVHCLPVVKAIIDRHWTRHDTASDRNSCTIIFINLLPCFALYRLHVPEPSSRISDARVCKRIHDPVQYVGVLLRLFGQRLPARCPAQRVLAKPMLQHAAASTRQTLGFIQRRQVRVPFILHDVVFCARKGRNNIKE